MKQGIDDFLRHLATEKRFSANTIAAYNNDLLQMADFFQSKGAKQWSGVDLQLVMSYFIDLKRRGYALATVARKTASARTLFKYLENEGAMRDKLTDNIGSPRVKKSQPRPLSEHHVRELLKQPDKYPTPEAKRDKAMLELLYVSGMQVTELTSLNMDSLNLQDDSVLITSSKDRHTSISRSYVPTLKKYMDEVRPQLMHHRDEQALFLNRLGQRLTRQGFWQIVKTYAREANLDSQVTLRSLRHGFVAASEKAKN
jgi:integrase/recombinase XerD